MRSRPDDGKRRRPSGNMGRDMRSAADDAPVLPFPVRSGGSRRRGAWSFDVAVGPVPTDGVTTGA